MTPAFAFTRPWTRHYRVRALMSKHFTNLYVAQLFLLPFPALIVDLKVTSQMPALSALFIPNASPGPLIPFPPTINQSTIRVDFLTAPSARTVAVDFPTNVRRAVETTWLSNAALLFYQQLF